MADTDLNLNFSQKYDEGAAGGSKYEETSNPLANTLSIPAPAGKTKEVVMAASPNTKKSKRYDHITEEAEKLQSNQTYLRAQAIAKNRAFDQRCVALHERIKRWETRCAEETEAREREDAAIRVAVSAKLAVLTEDFLTKLDEKCKAIHVQTWENGTVGQRYDAWYQDFRHFVDIVVPEVIEKQQGEVTRHLKKARETFDIDNTKLMKREQKIIERFEEHQVSTKDDFEQETKTRIRAQRILEELIDERNRVWDRCEEDFYAPFMTQIQECKGLLTTCIADRKANDTITLESMKVSMDRIQKVILKNFGGGRASSAGSKK
eukprot:g4519.t1